MQGTGNGEQTLLELVRRSPEVATLVDLLENVLLNAEDEARNQERNLITAKQDTNALETASTEIKVELEGIKKELEKYERQAVNYKSESVRLQTLIQKHKMAAHHAKIANASLAAKFNQDLNKMHRDAFVANRKSRFKGRRLPDIGTLKLEPVSSDKLAPDIAELCFKISPKLRQYHNGVLKIPCIECLRNQAECLVEVLRTGTMASVASDNALPDLPSPVLEIDTPEWQEMLQY